MIEWNDISPNEQIKRDFFLYLIICSIVLMLLSPLIYVIIKHNSGLNSLWPLAIMVGILGLFLTIATSISIKKNKIDVFPELKVENDSFSFIMMKSGEKSSISVKDIDSIYLIKGLRLIFITMNSQENEKFTKFFNDTTKGLILSPKLQWLVLAAQLAYEEKQFNAISKLTKFSSKVRDIKGLEKFLDRLKFKKEKDWKQVYQGHPLITYQKSV